MNRRTILAGLSGAMIGPALAGPATANAPDLWAAWKARFLTDEGRVVDHLQDAVSHSEGQGYGMLLAQAHGDRAAFDAMEGWVQAHLLIRDDPLMAWRWRPGEPDRGADWHTATDGDLFRAWALMRGEVFSGWEGAGAGVADIVGAIAALCLAPDPRTQGEPVLVPSAESPRGGAGVLFNPSYVMPRAMRELGSFAGMPDLIRAADHGETLLSELAASGPIPDWVSITPDGYSPAPDYSAAQGYDAMRVGLYLMWSDRADHPAVRRQAGYYDGGAEVPVVVSPTGHVQTRSTYPGYHALADLVRCAPPRAVSDSAEPYYPATLGLLAGVARREGATCGT
ncbi:MAG: glycosyl hydrolase family 8 [Pseudomonadota bacterium]|nr:glycosyl hydrolase family 8 [Pseudomonadota bacterium]